MLPDGRVIRTARRARKSAAGYDLTRLFVGSEGTLGVITEVTVRLYGIPAAISSAVCSFPSVEAAVNVVIKTIQAAVPVARIELADAVQMDAINRYSKLDLPVAPTLWLEFHGTEASVEEQAKMVQMIASDHGGTDFSWTTKPEDRHKLWRARHDVVYADKALRDGAAALGDRCLRADFAAGRMHHRNAEGPRSLLSTGADRWPCRRRQFSRLLRAQSERPEGNGGGRTTQSNGWSIGRCLSTAPAPASTALAAARSISCSPSTARQ